MVSTWMPGRHRSVRDILWHHLNALHVLARLTDLGVPLPRARALARRWEVLAHSWLYRISTMAGQERGSLRAPGHREHPDRCIVNTKITPS